MIEHVQSVITDFPDPALVKNLEKNVTLLGGTEGKTEALVRPHPSSSNSTDP
jgi:hypothetical protein